MLAGVDGCRNGWVVALAPAWPGTVEIRAVRRFDDVLNLTKGCIAVAVDMPIGLPSGAEVRDCDLAARKALGSQASSVFFAPPRETLFALTPHEFQQLHRQCRGKGAGLPLWGIVPKIIEVDERISPDLQKRVFEGHPELVWRRLAGSNLPSKHGAAGIVVRMKCLQALQVDYELSTTLDGVKIDDMLDAVVLLACASWRLNDTAVRYPTLARQIDAKGLVMEIWG